VQVVVSPGQAGPRRYFSETGQSISGSFAEFWELSGGRAVLGLPITPARDELDQNTGQSSVRQWFERSRLELQPGVGGSNDVVLGRLGLERLVQLGIDTQRLPREQGPRPECLWFEQTGHNVCDQTDGVGFKTYWQTRGVDDPRADAHARSVQLFGLPLTEQRTEVDADGATVLVQWFERARFEWHPDHPDAEKVHLAPLGLELRRAGAGP
jgi:hypothetical protein